MDCPGVMLVWDHAEDVYGVLLSSTMFSSLCNETPYFKVAVKLSDSRLTDDETHYEEHNQY
jgi:hypothetical protein